MKQSFYVPVLLFTLFTLAARAQQADPSSFHGAEATSASYKVVYFIDQLEDKKIRGTLRNINNALEDPRLKGKITVELVAFGDGVEMFKKTNPYDTLLLALQRKGVILAECENTIRERKISKDELWPFISFVPSGNGEIIIRQQHGWASVHP